MANPVGASNAQWMMVDLLGVLHYLHEMVISHRDIKPENIIVSDDGKSLKLIDFGLAGTKSHCHKLMGTYPFLLPLQLAGEMYRCACADIFACGGVFIELLCGPNTCSMVLCVP